jgi:hypothetical protein
MANLVDYMIGLFNNPQAAQAFVADPNAALGAAGIADVSDAQVQAVAASVTPLTLGLGDLDPVAALQRAISEHHHIEPAPTPETSEASSWAQTSQEAEGRFSVGFDAIGMDQAPGADATPAQEAGDRFGVGFDPIGMEQAAGADAAPVDEVPADTVLLPYFEVDLDESGGSTSLMPPDGA